METQAILNLIILFVGTNLISFILGAKHQRSFWKPLLDQELRKNKPKPLESLESKKYRTDPIVCGIDDRAHNCGDEICDRLMSPITMKHLEPEVYPK